MGESLTGILVKVHDGLAAPKDVRQFLDHLLSQNHNYTVTWQTIEAFNSILDTCADVEANEELLDVLFDSFNYVSENSCDENSWSDFGFELSGLIAKFLRAIQNSRRFGYFFCKLLLSINYIVKHYQEVWRSVSRLLLNIFINKKLSFNYLQDSLKSFIYILRNVDPSTLIAFAQQNLKLLCSFSMLIQNVGDFESQFDILEIIFLHILDDRKLAKEFFTQNEEIAKLFQNLDFKRFEVDCRIFINSLNNSLGSERKVFTIKCNQFSLGGRCLELLEEEKCIWLDANVNSKRLSIACSSFDSDTISFGSRCLIFIPMMDVIDFKAQTGTAAGEDCYCLKILIKDLTQSYQNSTSNEMVCTALHSCNSIEDIGYFVDFLKFFKERREMKKSVCTEGLVIASPGNPDKEDMASMEASKDGLFLPNFTKLNKGFLKEKKVQDNAVSSSNHNKKEPVATALDLFKDDKEVESRPKRKSYGIFIGGGLTEPLVLQHSGVVLKLSPRRDVSSDESGGSSPRRSARLKIKSDVSYCEDDIIPGTAPENQSPKRLKKNNVQSSPTELLQEKLKKKISPEVQSEKDKNKRGRPKKVKKEEKNKKLFSSQENATQIFDDVCSPVEKDLPLVTPKKSSKGKEKASSAPRQKKEKAAVPRRGKSWPDRIPKREEKVIKNTSLLDPNGYAYKRWTSGETSERGKFWLDKIKKIDDKSEYESETIFDFSEDDSDVFVKKKTRGRKKKADVKVSKMVGSSVPKTNKKSEPKNKRKSSVQKVKEETPKAKSAKIEKKKNPRKPAINVEKVRQKPVTDVQPEVQVQEKSKLPPKIPVEEKPELQPEVPEERELGHQPDIPDESVINPDLVPEEHGVHNDEIAPPPENLFEEEKVEQFEVSNNEALPEDPIYEEVVPPNDLGQDPNLEDNEERMNISSDESQGNPRNYDNLILGQESSDDQINNNVIIKELTLNSVIDPKLPVLKIDYEGGKIKIIQTNSKVVVEQHQKESLKKVDLDESVKDPSILKSINPCGSLSLNSSTNDTVSSPRVIVNPLKSRKRYTKKKRDMNIRKPKRKIKDSSSEEENVKPSPKKVSETKTEPKRKNKNFSSDEAKSKSSPKKILERKSETPKRKMKDSSCDEEILKLSPKKTPEPKKRKLDESSDELSEEEVITRNRISEIITRLKERNREKNKMETDSIIETIEQGNGQLLKSLNKKDSLKFGDYAKKIEEMIPGNPFEKDLSKKCERFEKCVTYFTAGCSVSDICEDMKETIAKVQESLGEDDSEDGKKDEEKIGRFSTRLEAVINCQTEAELKSQLKNTINKMFSVLKFNDDVNFY